MSRFENLLLLFLWRRACARGAELPLGDVHLVAGPEALRLVPSAQDGREPGGAS